MGKKKVEILFKVDLKFDDKIKITKQFLKSYIESKIRNIQVITYNSFNTSKDTTKAKIITNIISLLDAEDFENTNDINEHSKIEFEETDIEKSLNAIKVIMSMYNDKSKKKLIRDNLKSYLDGIENSLMKTSFEFNQMKTMNDEMGIKVSVLEAENDILNEKVHVYKTKVSTYEQSLEDKSLVHKLEALASELATNTIKISKLESKYLEAQEKINQLTKEKLKSESEIEKGIDIGVDIQTELIRAKREIKLRGAKLTYMTIALSEKEDELMQCMYDYNKMSKDLNMFKEKSNENKYNEEYIKDKIKSAQDNIIELKNENNTLKESLKG